MKIRENVPISKLTTMRIGGPARFVIEIEKESDIPKAYNFAEEKNLPVFILGGGANIIGHDEGFDGVIKNTMTGIRSDETFSSRAASGRPVGLRPFASQGASATGGRRSSSPCQAPDPLAENISSPCYITVMGGEEWDNVVAFACARDLTGIEALSKIPGSVGAAPVQNIGAYGQDISDTFFSARGYDTKTKEFKTLYKNDLKFSYRKSILNTTEKGRYFVISVTFALQKGEMKRPFYNSIEKYISEHNITDFSPKSIREIVSKIRADKLPDPKIKASAGSFFKNIYLTEEEAKIAEAKGYPVYHGHDGLKINSGWLIEQAGFKGQLLHGIRINEKAALVLINENADSFSDLAAARTEIIDEVYNQFGYRLEQEPVEISCKHPFEGHKTRASAPERSEKGCLQRNHTKLLDGRELAGFIKERQAHVVRSMNKKPTLLILRDSDNPVILKYVNLKIKYGEDIGINVISKLAKDTDEIKTEIENANQNPEINGIILQLPILDKEKTDNLTSLITESKDVDGLSGKANAYDSATATAINWLLAGYDINLKNQKIAIVGRGKLVGAPLQKMWQNSNYNVTVFHRGDDLTKLADYDIIITATGVPNLITPEMVKPGAVIVDAGTASENGKLVGDVADTVREEGILKAITPKLGGVGPLTITCLFEHVIQATK